MNLARMQAIKEEIRLNEALTAKLATDELTHTIPNPTQMRFLNSTRRYAHMSGGNQLGKSWAAKMLAKIWLTGKYPDWYKGPRIVVPEKDSFGIVALGAYSKQKLASLFHEPLFGPYGDLGSGWIPKDMIDIDHLKRTMTRDRENPNYIAAIRVRQPNGKFIEVRSYMYGHGEVASIRRVQGEPFLAGIIDEEPPEEFWDEFKSRFIYTQGYVRVPATPQFGESKFYLEMADEGNPLTEQVVYTVDDATHLTPEHRQAIIEEHQHSPIAMARLYGQPVIGHGLIFPTAEQLVVEDFPMPDHWKYVIGIDVPHTTGYYAAALLGVNPEDGRVHVFNEYQDKGQAWEVYAAATKRLGGDRIQVAYPHDASIKIGGSAAACELLADQGVQLMSVSAHMLTPEKKRDRSPMTAVEMITALISSGRFTVAESCTELRAQMKKFSQEDGKIVDKQNDHVIDAVLKAMMMLRFAKPLVQKNHQQVQRLGEYNFYA